MMELARINIKTKVLLLSSHVVLPKEGHLDAAVNVITHVCQRYSSSLVYNPSYPEIDHIVFKKCDWSEFYRDSKEAILMNTPESHKQVDIHMFVDSWESIAGHIPNNDNVPDLMVKLLFEQKRKYLVSNSLYDIHDDP